MTDEQDLKARLLAVAKLMSTEGRAGTIPALLREAAAAAQPDGWALVPRELPESWQEAMCEAHEFSGFHDLMGPMGAAYAKLIELAAAPQPDSQKSGESDYSACCDTPAYCSGVRRCTAKDERNPNSAAPGGDVRLLQLAQRWEMLADKFYEQGSVISKVEAASMRNDARELREVIAALSAPKQTEPTSIHPSHFWIEDGDEYI